MWKKTFKARQLIVSLGLLGLSGLGVTGCATGEQGPELRVDLRTDYAPGIEFDAYRITLREVGGDGEARLVERGVVVGEIFLPGIRVATFEGVRAGRYAIEATLVSDGSRRAARAVALKVTGSRGVTVAISRSCVDLNCPGLADPENATACIGERCVPEDCIPEEPGTCGEPECASDADCMTSSVCATPRCLEGTCWDVVIDGACPEGEWCSPDMDACVPLPSLLGDASMPECTEDAGCDDGNACTDDSCLEGRCVRRDNEASCDDGLYCNGADTCMGGACSVHAGSPCRGAMMCDEEREACMGCAMDAECPEPMVSAWSGCGSFGSTCGESGTRERTRTSYRCVASVCEPSEELEMGGCSRSTDGVTCGTTSVGEWSACGGFADACDESGTRSRILTIRVCGGGSCTLVLRTESGACSRSVSDGTSCGGDPWLVCCGTACTDMRSDRNCGSCGTDCTTEGLSCSDTGAGPVGVVDYACGRCVSNPQCQRLLDSAATCWDTTNGSTNYCQCQCPGSADICADAGCGPGMYCVDCPGHNYCSSVPRASCP